MSKLTVLLDIDNTILDISSVHEQIAIVIDDNYGQGSSEKFWEVYEAVRSELGYIDAKEIAIRFARIVDSPNLASAIAAFEEVPFEKYLLPGAKELLDFLSSNTNLVIFSDGDEMFQGAKVKRLGLDKIASEVIISKSKVDQLAEIGSKYPDLIIIDDKPKIQEKAKEVIPDCKRIWVKFGKYAESKSTIDADLETDDLVEVRDYLQRLSS